MRRWNVSESPCSIPAILIDIRFLLAQLNLDSLKGKRSPKAIRVALKKLAKGSDTYDTTYDDAMERIQNQPIDRKELALETLSWITCAKRPLTTIELQHALGVELDEPKLDEDNLPDLRDIVSNYCGLVTVDEKSDIIRLVHYTAQEYFKRAQIRWLPYAQSEITNICATYLSFQAFEHEIYQNDSEFEKRLALYPLYNYTSHHWGDHAYEVPDYDKIREFLTIQSKVNAYNQGLLTEQRWSHDSGYSQRVPEQMTELHLAAIFGLLKIIIILLDNQDPNQSNKNGQTTLSYAAEHGHEAVVRLLLDKGADIEAVDREGRMTALLYTTKHGHEVVARLLLDKGANIEAIDK